MTPIRLFEPDDISPNFGYEVHSVEHAKDLIQSYGIKRCDVHTDKGRWTVGDYWHPNQILARYYDWHQDPFLPELNSLDCQRSPSCP